MTEIIQQFRNAIEASGLVPPNEIINDGAIHRFSSSGKPADKNGWYILHLDGIAAGAFGDWREGFAASAHQRWMVASPCTQHEYLIRKGISPNGARIEGDKLLIAMRDTAGKVHSLQTIATDGIKMFMSGGRIKGCFFGIGKPKGALIVCEGFATGASIHECTGHAVAVAFNAGNLEAVAVALRIKYPELKIIIAADDDHQTPGNPGLTKATAAVKAACASLAMPVFKEAA